MQVLVSPQKSDAIGTPIRATIRGGGTDLVELDVSAPRLSGHTVEIRELVRLSKLARGDLFRELRTKYGAHLVAVGDLDRTKSGASLRQLNAGEAAFVVQYYTELFHSLTQSHDPSMESYFLPAYSHRDLDRRGTRPGLEKPVIVVLESARPENVIQQVFFTLSNRSASSPSVANPSLPMDRLAKVRFEEAQAVNEYQAKKATLNDTEAGNLAARIFNLRMDELALTFGPQIDSFTFLYDNRMLFDFDRSTASNLLMNVAFDVQRYIESFEEKIQPFINPATGNFDLEPFSRNTRPQIRERVLSIQNSLRAIAAWHDRKQATLNHPSQ